MKQQKRKGFTLVELLVVIAILAILATVSIVGYATFVKKAKVSNDTALAKQINDLLMADEAINGKPADTRAMLKVLNNNGFVLANLNPTADGNWYAYDQANNQILYLDSNLGIIYQAKSEVCANTEWIYIVSSDEVKATLIAKNVPESQIINTTISGAEVANQLTAGGDIVLPSNVDMTNNAQYTDGSTWIVTDSNLDLDGNSLSTKNLSYENANAEIKNGTITVPEFGVTYFPEYDLTLLTSLVTFVNNAGDGSTKNLVMEDVTVHALPEANGQYYSLMVEGPANVNVTDSKIYGVSTFNNSTMTISGNDTVFDQNGVIGNALFAFTGEGNTLNISGGKYSTTKSLIELYLPDAGSKIEATINISGGTFNVGQHLFVVYQPKHDTIMLPGEDPTLTFDLPAGVTINITGGTFNVDPSACVADGYHAQQNADGTWTVVKG